MSTKEIAAKYVVREGGASQGRARIEAYTDGTAMIRVLSDGREIADIVAVGEDYEAYIKAEAVRLGITT